MPLLELIEGNPLRVLEVGCGHGRALVFAKQNRSAKFVAGVELVPEVAAIARQNPEIDLVLTGDVESIQLDFPAGHFDLIIASHVLEHVKDPWSVTRRLATLLSPGGQFIGSLPNVRNARVSLPLVFLGKLEYSEEGILDWTHTKFFTRSTIHDLLQSSGFSVQKIEPEFLARAARINKMTCGVFKDLLCFTYNFSARPGARATSPDGRNGRSARRSSTAVGHSWCSIE
jgi:2-polyprenyl-3-methyl-5-hydroxy-6-metoxy-1,4-benzoquinol methylase